jgi:hypothetical protein
LVADSNCNSYLPKRERERKREPFNQKFNKSLTSDNINGTKEAAKKKNTKS